MTKIEQIKGRVKIEEVLARYWSEPNRDGRYKCAFHNGKDYNMLVKNGFAYCFVCNESADCVKLTSKIFNISIGQAIKKIDEDFNLGLCKPLTVQEKRKFAEEQQKRERERERKERMAQFENECIALLTEKLRVADEYIGGKAFVGAVGSAEKYQYTDSPDFSMYMRAIERKRFLEWLYCVITGDSHYLVEEDFCLIYGTDKKNILRKVYKGEIKI